MYNGIEIDMLSLGDADCVLVSLYNGMTVRRVLIDGGNKGDAPTIRAFLRGRNIDTIDDVLSTHHHDDHSGGLIELLSDSTLEVRKVLVPIPQWHVDMDKVWGALKDAEPSDEAANIRGRCDGCVPLCHSHKSEALPMKNRSTESMSDS